MRWHFPWNSDSGGLRPSTLPLRHRGSPQYSIFANERGRNILFLWNLKARVGFDPMISHFLSRQLYPLHQGPHPLFFQALPLRISTPYFINKEHKLNWARRTSWGWWDEWDDTSFEIRILAVWGRARYLSVTEAPHNIWSLRMSGEETFCFFETWSTLH